MGLPIGGWHEWHCRLRRIELRRRGSVWPSHVNCQRLAQKAWRSSVITLIDAASLCHRDAPRDWAHADRSAAVSRLSVSGVFESVVALGISNR